MKAQVHYALRKVLDPKGCGFPYSEEDVQLCMDLDNLRDQARDANYRVNPMDELNLPT